MSDALGFLVVSTFLAGLFLLLQRRHLRSSLDIIPQAPASEASIWWGHEYRAFTNRIVNSEYFRWTLEVAPVFRIKSALFQRDTIVVADGLAVQYILQNAYEYIKPPAYSSIIVKVVGRGLIWAEGNEHMDLRKRVSHAFTPAILNGMVSDVVQCAEACVERLRADMDAIGPNKALNLALYTGSCTLQAIARAGFGQEFPYDSPEAIAISSSWHSDVQGFSTFSGFLFPVLVSVFPWIMKLPIRAIRDAGATRKVVLDLGRELIKKDKINADGRDILSHLIKDWTLTEDQLIENIFTFFVAGHETASATLNFTLWELATRKDCQDALRKELVGVDASNYDVLDRLPYLDAVTREGLRLFPGAKDAERVSTRDDEIPLQQPIRMLDGKVQTSIHVKAGQHFILPWTVMNTNPTTWGPDAQEFKPQRWLQPGGVPSSGLPRGPFSNLASFSDGPRGCIGWRFAVMELKILFAVLVKSFEFSPAGVDITRRFSPGLTPFVGGKSGQLPLLISHAE